MKTKGFRSLFISNSFLVSKSQGMQGTKLVGGHCRPRDILGGSSRDDLWQIWYKIWVPYQFLVIWISISPGQKCFEVRGPVTVFEAIWRPASERFWPGEIPSKWPGIATPLRFCPKFSKNHWDLNLPKIPRGLGDSFLCQPYLIHKKAFLFLANGSATKGLLFTSAIRLDRFNCFCSFQSMQFIFIVQCPRKVSYGLAFTLSATWELLLVIRQKVYIFVYKRAISLPNIKSSRLALTV